MTRLVSIALCLCPALAWGQAGTYASADYARGDCYPRDHLVACWDLDPGVRGDATQGAGDFESWAGSHGTCGDCPISWACYCAGTSTISTEASKRYKNATSAKFSIDASNNAALLYFQNTFEANKYYMISFWYKGNSGNEDFYLSMQNGGSTDFYNFTTDTWGGGSAYVSYNNIIHENFYFFYFFLCAITKGMYFALYIPFAAMKISLPHYSFYYTTRIRTSSFCLFPSSKTRTDSNCALFVTITDVVVG